ncbi:hypothetical protein LSAT2_015757 [Lamellibrachia satsuma]|nr:hypothetical protein LSAT2_015757 [Lamellibrachia satsuma]
MDIFVSKMMNPSQTITVHIDNTLLQRVANNHHVLKKIAKAFLFCGRQCIALRGDEESLERKIQESNRTIDCLRKSMLEQQLQNENLSLKLQEEIASRDEIMQKINATRDMCNLLKDFAAKVDGKLQQCEREHDDLKYLELNHQKQYEVQYVTLYLGAIHSY